MQAAPIETRGTRVLVADAMTERRTALVRVLDRSDQFDVVGQASDGFEAVNAAKALQPDVALLALNLPRMSGLDALRYVRSAVPDSVVIVASTPWEDAFVAELQALLRAGEHRRDVDACEVDLPASASGAGIAREFVDDQLGARRLFAVAGIATLLVSEVVTNAVVHARSASRLAIVRAGSVLRVQVTDWGDGAVELRDLAPTAIGGRGLHIVDALADRWGTVATRAWKTVWFEIAAAGAGDHAEEQGTSSNPAV